jgi:hypothetical protein
VEADPLDAGARRVLLTDHGVAAMIHGTGVLLRVEAEVTPHLAARDVKELKRLRGRALERRGAAKRDGARRYFFTRS